MDQTRETFHKSERLCSRKTITALFDEGNVFYSSFLKIVWLKSPVSLPSPAQVAVTVSKRGFRKAVTRNIIKRRIREAYRKNKKSFYDSLLNNQIQVAFIIIFNDNEIRDYATIEKSMKEMLNKFTSILEGKYGKC